MSQIDQIHDVGVGGTPFVPSIDDYHQPSPGWAETEYHCFRDPSDQVLVAAWTGEPGEVGLPVWPYDEVCVLVEGRVAIRAADGSRREFGAGEAFVVPRGFSGVWETLEPTRKVFVAIETAITCR